MELHVEVDGAADAAAVVFLHGVTGSGRTYAWLRPEDVGGRRLVRIDLRGHGDSPHAPGTYRMGPYADDVVAILRAIDGPPPVLVGHSLGGVVAWTIAQRHPELIAGALLEDPPLLYADPAEALTNPALAIFAQLRALVVAWREAGLSEAEVAQHLAAAPGGDRLAVGAPLVRAHGLTSMDIGVLDAAIDNSCLDDVDLQAPVGVPMRIVAADDAVGAAFPTRHQHLLATSHPDVEVEVVVGASHLIHDEARSRERYRRALAAFVARCG